MEVSFNLYASSSTKPPDYLPVEMWHSAVLHILFGLINTQKGELRAPSPPIVLCLGFQVGPHVFLALLHLVKHPRKTMFPRESGRVKDLKTTEADR
jgi:hypothetical protein